ncbi:MAG: AmmeMemoRadiSam system protein A [Lachnospiraceae bacterium]|nr:AmmeMemoRadiSam system protein A [Lachnospiraceae bacterium]
MAIIRAFTVPHPPLIVPDVGRGGEKQVIRTIESYEKVADEIASLKPETIIITSPHATMYSDYFHISPGRRAEGSFASFRAPGVTFSEEYDSELVSVIERLAEKESFPAGTAGERDSDLDHGTMVPLYFIEKKYKDFKLVRIGLSGLPLTDHYRFGTIIKEAVRETDRKAVFVASGDLSHKLQEYGPYGFSPEGPEYDSRVMKVLSSADFGELFDFSDDFCNKAAECGHRSFVIMAGALDGLNVRSVALSHEDVTGVGYGICILEPGDDNAGRRFLDKRLGKIRSEVEKKVSDCDEYVKLAYDTINAFIGEGKRIDIPADIPDRMLNDKAGAFVSIHEHGMLRGCIGTILPVTGCVASEIISNAISASTRDPRFSPIKKDELPYLEISVDVLGTPEDIDSEDELDVKRYGVIVYTNSKRGLLLPDLEGVDTVSEQIDIARRKAGIGPNEPYRLQRFEVIRHV